MTRTERAWQVLGTVLDPEVPALSVRDLGIVREVTGKRRNRVFACGAYLDILNEGTEA